MKFLQTTLYITPRKPEYSLPTETLDEILKTIENFDYVGSEKPFIFDDKEGLDPKTSKMFFELLEDGLRNEMKNYPFHQIDLIAWELDELLRLMITTLETEINDQIDCEIDTISLLSGRHEILNAEGKTREARFSIALKADAPADADFKELKKRLKQSKDFAECIEQLEAILNEDLDFFFGAS